METTKLSETMAAALREIDRIPSQASGVFASQIHASWSTLTALRDRGMIEIFYSGSLAKVRLATADCAWLDSTEAR